MPYKSHQIGKHRFLAVLSYLVDLKGFPPQGGINLESLAPRQNKKPPKGDFCFGGPEGIRTLDLSDANRTLSQLSYKPVPLYYTQFFQKCKKNYIKYHLCRILKTGILLMCHSLL